MTARVRVWRVRPEDADLALPETATAGSVGLDLRAAVPASVELRPGARLRVPTGLALAIPPGFEGQVRPRSGLAFEHGVTCLNAPGTIDPDFRGEIQVLLWNAGEKSFSVERGERIAQLVIAAVAEVELVEVDSPESLGDTARGGGGFGHTGR